MADTEFLEQHGKHTSLRGVNPALRSAPAAGAVTGGLEINFEAAMRAFTSNTATKNKRHDDLSSGARAPSGKVHARLAEGREVTFAEGKEETLGSLVKTKKSAKKKKAKRAKKDKSKKHSSSDGSSSSGSSSDDSSSGESDEEDEPLVLASLVEERAPPPQAKETTREAKAAAVAAPEGELLGDLVEGFDEVDAMDDAPEGLGDIDFEATDAGTLTLGNRFYYQEVA